MMADSSGLAPAGALPAGACPSCGQGPFGRYCAHCGERRLHPDDLTVVHFLKESFRHVSEMDAGLPRTLRTLLTRPGLLTVEYMVGRRRPYLSPLQLFLLVNVFFFVAESALDARVLSTRLQSHLYQQPYSELARDLVARQTGGDLPGPEFIAAFDTMVHAQAKTLVIVLVPLFAALVALLQLRRRRPVVQHLVFSSHLAAVFLLTIVAFGVSVYLLAAGARAVGVDPYELLNNQDPISGVFMLGLFAPYTALAFARAYGDRLVVAAAKGLFLTFGCLFLLSTYRVILFFTTLWTVNG